ncbi:hypothetical protein JYU14_01260 [Simkania negevensis]|uniref:Uncharacterized protein n=1 Tax=Simkania negevensis TaxID=83561 RepID=A0ABS3AQW4_9BACT|nr:hypothetical protein [Simkania negevensis]
MNIERGFSDFDPTHKGIEYTRDKNEAEKFWGRSITVQEERETLYLSPKDVAAFLKNNSALTSEEELRVSGGEADSLLRDRLSDVLSRASSSASKRTSQVGSPIFTSPSSTASSPSSFPREAILYKDDKPEQTLIKQLLLGDDGGKDLTEGENQEIEQLFQTMLDQLAPATTQDRMTFYARTVRRIGDVVNPQERITIVKGLLANLAQDKEATEKKRKLTQLAATQAKLRKADAEVRRYHDVMNPEIRTVMAQAKEVVLSSKDPTLKQTIEEETKQIKQEIIESIVENDPELKKEYETSKMLPTETSLSRSQRRELRNTLKQRLWTSENPTIQRLFSEKAQEIVNQSRKRLADLAIQAKKDVLFSDNPRVEEIVKAEKNAPAFLDKRNAVMLKIIEKDMELWMNYEANEYTFPSEESLSEKQKKEFDHGLRLLLLDSQNPQLQKLFQEKEKEVIQQHFGLSITQLNTGTANVVYKVDADEKVSAYTKKIPENRSRQKVVDISTVGALSEPLKGANLVRIYRRTSKQTAEEAPADLSPASNRSENFVTASPIDRLTTNPAKVNWQSSASQHTALFALSLQLWDGHRKNMWMDGNSDLIIGDYDDAVLESNLITASGNVVNSPLGQLYLQTVNPTIDEAILEEHLDELGESIALQIPVQGRDFVAIEEKGENEPPEITQVNFSEEESEMITDLVEQHFGKNRWFLIHGRDNNISSGSITLADVRLEFAKVTEDPRFKTLPIWKELRNEGLSDEQIAMLQRQPMLLHPKNCSIAQLQALRERKARLEGFLALKKMFNNPKDFQGDPIVALYNQREALLDHLDSMPITTSEKQELRRELSNIETTPDGIKKAEEILEGPIKWNQLAYAAYPTLARMHQWAAKVDALKNQLSNIPSSNIDEKVKLLKENIDDLPIPPLSIRPLKLSLESDKPEDHTAAVNFVNNMLLQANWSEPSQALSHKFAHLSQEQLRREITQYSRFQQN